MRACTQMETSTSDAYDLRSDYETQPRNGITGQKSLLILLTSIALVTTLLGIAVTVVLQHQLNRQEISPSLPDPQALLSVKKVQSFVPSTKDSSEIPSNDVQAKSTEKVCLTRGCIKAAAALMENMDESVDPCNDFFDFSCGGFVKRTIIPDEKSSVSTMTLITDSLQERLRLVIDTPITNQDSQSTVLTKKFFKSCKNKSRIDDMGLSPIKKIIQELGGWPVVEGASLNAKAFSWIEAMYNNRKLGLSADYFFDFSVDIDFQNSSWRIIWLDQPRLGLAREYYMKGLDDADVKAYLKYLVGVAALFGADPERAEKEMKEVLLFEMQLAKISLPREELRNISKLYNIRSINDLQRILPQVPWIEYMNKLLPPLIKVENRERIGVSVPSYFANLSTVIENTDSRVLANYVIWRVVIDSVTYLSEDIRSLQLALKKQLTGADTRPPRWKECISIVSSSLQYAVGNLYVKNYFDKTSKYEMERIVRYVREEFDRILNSIEWMDESTKKAAKNKSKAIKEYIGYPEELLSDQKLSEYYKSLTLDDENFLKNALSFYKFAVEDSFSHLRTRVDKTDWKLHASVAEVNAYYTFVENAIQFYAGILQGTFFEPERPKYMNYGSIGFVVGHEITHGFDDQGRQFNDNGDLENWWNSATEKNFLEKANCIQWQYGNYTDPQTGTKLNGINSLGENIADCGGVNEAYKAYQVWVRENGPELPLPGLKYTPNQLFWISTGQNGCSKYKEEAMKQQVLTGIHTPWKFRTLGSLRNSEAFSKDWNCPLGSKMNPKEKCVVW